MLVVRDDDAARTVTSKGNHAINVLAMHSTGIQGMPVYFTTLHPTPVFAVNLETAIAKTAAAVIDPESKQRPKIRITRR